MASVVKFTATKLASTGKQGILKPDADGYYTMPIGALNAFNSAGEYYTLNGAKELFEQSSIFMRRIKNGCLKGETGHPKRLPGMSMDDYINRILTIDEKNVCCHFKEVWLDEQFGANNPEFKNPRMVAIMGKVKPTGPHAASLKASFDNPSENVCFSIRALTRDYYERGQTYRVLTSIVTWDNVNEPGLSNATKWSSPALESIGEQTIIRRNLESLVQNVDENIVMESTKELAAEALSRSFIEPVKSPLYLQW